MVLSHPFDVYYLLSTGCVPGSVLGVAETKNGKEKSIYLCADGSFYLAASASCPCFSSFFFLYFSLVFFQTVKGQMTSEGTI